jgi:hypothetical protein
VPAAVFLCCVCIAQELADHCESYINDPYYGSGVPPNPPVSGVPAQGYNSMHGAGVPPNPPGYVVPARGYDSMCIPGVLPSPTGYDVPVQGWYPTNAMPGSCVPVAKSGLKKTTALLHFYIESCCFGGWFLCLCMIVGLCVLCYWIALVFELCF